MALGSQAAFTLLEVIIGLVLAMTMLISFIPTLFVMGANQKTSSDRTSASNVGISLVEQLYNLDFTVLGTDTYTNCKNANGKVVKGTTGGVCAEDLLSETGYSSTQGSGETSFYFKRYSIVCTNSNDLAGGYTGDACSIPTANLTAGPVPDGLKCVSSSYTASLKEIKVLTAVLDRNGKCHPVYFQILKFSS
jgi:type II secretory pathway pseudopilin PulG